VNFPLLPFLHALPRRSLGSSPKYAVMAHLAVPAQRRSDVVCRPCCTPEQGTEKGQHAEHNTFPPARRRVVLSKTIMGCACSMQEHSGVEWGVTADGLRLMWRSRSRVRCPVADLIELSILRSPPTTDLASPWDRTVSYTTALSGTLTAMPTTSGSLVSQSAAGSAVPTTKMLQCPAVVQFTVEMPAVLDAVLHVLGSGELLWLVQQGQCAVPRAEKTPRWLRPSSTPDAVTAAALAHLLAVGEVEPQTLLAHPFALADLIALPARMPCATDLPRLAVVIAAVSAEPGGREKVHDELCAAWLAATFWAVTGSPVEPSWNAVGAAPAMPNATNLDRLLRVALTSGEVPPFIGALCEHSETIAAIVTSVSVVLAELAVLVPNDGNVGQNIRHADDISTAIGVRHAPYNFGAPPLNRAFAAATRRLSRATMCAWECTDSSDWPVEMPTWTLDEQRATLRACHSRNVEIKKIKKQLASTDGSMTSSSEAGVTSVSAQIVELNRLNAAAVNGGSEVDFRVLTERGLFLQSREFSDRAASRSDVLPAEIFQAGRNAWTCFALQVIFNSTAADCHDGVFGYSVGGTYPAARTSPDRQLTSKFNAYLASLWLQCLRTRVCHLSHTDPP
jgi:hypothetical protein